MQQTVLKRRKTVKMTANRGGSSVLDDRFTRYTQFLKFGPLKQRFLRSGVTF